MNNIEIVVSRYSENLDWLSQEPFSKYPVTIYNKGNHDNFNHSSNIIKVVNLPNIGLEVHSFLYHIINNYDNLSDITAFFQGSISSSVDKYRRARDVVIESENRNTSILSCPILIHNYFDLTNFTIDYHPFSNEINRTEGSNLTHPCKIRPFGKWFNEIFNKWHSTENGDVTSLNNISWNHVFSVKREHILRKPKEYYEYLLSFVEEGLQPEAVHYFERAWALVFYPLNNENFIR